MRIENWKEKFDELSRCKSWELDKDAFMQIFSMRT